MLMLGAGQGFRRQRGWHMLAFAMSERNLQKRLVRLMAQAAACSLPLCSSAIAQPCNPIIDGTYCATQMPRASATTSSGPAMRPIQDIGGAMSTSQSSIGTLGGISFQGGTTCIGLLRRGNCN